MNNLAFTEAASSLCNGFEVRCHACSGVLWRSGAVVHWRAVVLWRVLWRDVACYACELTI